MSNPGQQTAEELRQREAELGLQTEALTHYKQVATSQELRLLQLEQEVNELCQRHGEAGRYPLKFEPDTKPIQAESSGDGATPLPQTAEKLSAELRESEERYRLLFESLNEGYCVIEKVGGEAGELLDFRYVEANPAFAAQTGLSGVLGKTLRQVLPNEFEERIRTYDSVHKTGESVRFQREFVTKGRVLELHAFRVADKTQGRVAINLQDITERKQAELLLRQNHDTFFNLIENAPFGLYVVDAQFRLRQVSTASRKMFSSIDPLIGRDFEEVLRLVWADPFVSEALGHFRHTLQTGEAYAAPNTTAQRQNIPDIESYDWKIERITLPDGQFGVVCYFYDITERMQAQAALRESEEFSRSIIQSSPDCIKVLDLKGNLLSIQSGHELLGIEDLQPFLNKSWLDFWEDADDKRAAQAAVASAAAGGAGAFVGFFRTSRGEAKWWDVAISPILDANCQPARLLAVSRDVTERQQADDVLRQSTVQFETLVNEAPLGVYLVDADFRIRQVNPAGLPKFGNIPDLIGRDFAEVMHILWPKTQADAAIQQFRQTLETGEPCFVPEMIERRADRQTIEYYEWQISRIPLPDGRYGVVCYFRDISERVLAQHEIRESEQRFRALVLASSDLMCRMSPDWSEMRQIYDRNFVVETDVLNGNWLEYYVYRDDQRQLVAAVNEAIRTKSLFEMEHRVRRADGSWGWMLSRAVPLLDASGEIVEWFGTGSDVTERKRAEQALRESEDRYRSLFNSIDAGFCIIEMIFDAQQKPVDYRFLEVNPAFDQHTGLHDAAGKRMRELKPDHDEEWFEIYGKVALTGEAIRFVNEAKAMDARWFDVYAFRLGGPGSCKVALLFNNITERIRRERNLGFLVELQQTLAGIDSCARLQQVAGKRIAKYLQLRHCLLTEINQATGQATVLHEYLAEGAPALERVRPLTELRTEAQRQALAAGQTLISADVLQEQRGVVELQRLAARGVRSQVSAPYVVDGHWTFLLTAMRGQPYDWPQDEVELITELAARVYIHVERARAQERLVESEERLRLAAEAAHFGTYDRDMGGAHFHISTEIKQMLGYLPDALLSHPQVMAHIHPDDRPAGLAAFQRACDPASDGQIAVEQRIVRRDGTLRWISSIGRVLFRDGVPRRTIGFWVDITERSRLERETLAQAQTLTELDRRKDEFLAMLGHELRNPLAALANAAQLLRLQEHEDASLKQCRSIIERQIGQLKHLVDDLLEVSRITTGSVRLRQEQIALCDIVERAVETAQPLIRQHRHQLKVSLPLEPVLLFADAARLEQVLVNLLTNAAKYTDEGGRIWLSVEAEKAAEVVANEAAAMVVIKVRDTGIGIAPELLPHIFDLFTQADRSLDRSQGGLGIGLCLVQRLVELHGGTVEAHSILGQGSEFVVRLPLMQTSLPTLPTLALSAPDTAPPPEKAATGCRVLVVDDNVDAAQSLGLLLEMSGHAVYLAYDGPSALQAAIALRPDVALLDIGLPGLDGFEVAQRIRHQAALKGMVLVALTGYGQDTDRQRSQDAGFDYHLVKPAGFDEIEKILLRVPERVI